MPRMAGEGKPYNCRSREIVAPAGPRHHLPPLSPSPLSPSAIPVGCYFLSLQALYVNRDIGSTALAIGRVADGRPLPNAARSVPFAPSDRDRQLYPVHGNDGRDLSYRRPERILEQFLVPCCSGRHAP